MVRSIPSISSSIPQTPYLSMLIGSFLIPSAVDYLSQALFKKHIGQLISILPAALSMWLISRYLPKELNYLMLVIYVSYKKTVLENEKPKPLYFDVQLPPLPPIPPLLASNIAEFHPQPISILHSRLHLQHVQTIPQLIPVSSRSLSVPRLNSEALLADLQADLARRLATTISIDVPITVNIRLVGSDEEGEVAKPTPVSPTFTFWVKLAKKIGITVPGLNSELSADEQVEKAKGFLAWLETEEVTNLLGELEELDFSKKSHYLPLFPHLELVLSKLKNIKKLKLCDNALTQIPPVIFQLKNLEVLKLADNRIEVLPEEVSLLSNLRKLDMSFNLLRTLPAKIVLPKLQVLALNKNELHGSSLKDVCFPHNLISLDLSQNSTLEALPPGIFQLTCLEELYVSTCGLLTLPLELVQLRSLKELSASNNQIIQLPLELANMKTLVALDLASNQFSEIPSEVLTLSNLMALDLCDNQIVSVPVAIAGLTNLQGLDLCSNLLTSLPQELSQLSQLEELQVGDNQLTDLPESFQYLPEGCAIYAENNQFTPERALQLQTMFLNRRLTSITQGPEFNFSVHDFDADEQLDGSLQNEIESWLQLAGEQKDSSCYEKLFYHEHKDRLHEFLTRLKLTQDFVKGGQSQKSIISRAVQMLDQAVCDEKFCKVMFGILQSALATCSQRIENAFDDIEIEMILSQADKLSDVELVKVLIGKKRRILLRDVAEKYAVGSGHGDQLAVVQFFQVELKTRLQLPISTQDLSYRGMVHATVSDLDSAVKQVLEQTTTVKQICQILLKERVWSNKLEVKYPDELERITMKFRPRLNEILEDSTLSENDQLSKSRKIEQERQKEITDYLAQKSEEWVREHSLLIK